MPVKLNPKTDFQPTEWYLNKRKLRIASQEIIPLLTCQAGSRGTVVES